MSKPGFIDSHAHFFPEGIFKSIWKWFDTFAWNINYKLPTDTLVKLLKEMGAERFVCYNYAHKPGISRMINEWTAEFKDKYPEVIPFAAVHPEDEDPGGELKRCFQKGFKGVKLHCHVIAISPDDERMFPIYDTIAENDKVLVIHAGSGPNLGGYSNITSAFSGAGFLEKMLKRYPGMKCVVPHFCADEFERCFALMDEYKNLYTDNTMVFSGFFPEVPGPEFFLKHLVRHQDRILYGTDFPNISYQVETELNQILGLPLESEAKEKILRGNAIRLFGLEQLNDKEEP